MTHTRQQTAVCLMAGWLVTCLSPGAQAHSVSAEKYNSSGSCAAFGDAVGRGVWNWCYNNEQDNMNGCKASFRAWVGKVERTCAAIRRESGCAPRVYGEVEWHLHGTEAGQTLEVHRAVSRTCGEDTGSQAGRSGAGDAPAELDREARRRVQSALAVQGFDPGPADGVFGPRTRGAVQAWQQANGYAATGELTSGQLERLLSAESPPGAGATAAGGGLHGSIAFSQLGGGGYAYAIAWNAQGREAARRSALEECGHQGGGSGCHEAGWFANQCGALAIGDGDGYGTGAGETNARAEDSALSNCRAANRNCRVEVSRCVDGDYKRPDRVAPIPSGPNCAGAREIPVCWRELSNRPGCYAWVYTYHPDKSLTWSGTCAGGTATGNGTLTWTKDGQTSEGTGTLLDGKRHGGWTYRWADGGRAEGSYVNGKIHGYWVEHSATGDHFEGEYRNGKRLSGTFTWANGNRYEGQWREGKRHGRGIFTFADGDRYEGPWRDGNRHGHGTYTFANGDRYEGPWRDGNRHGRGTYTFADGDVMTCEYRDDEIIDGTCEFH